MVDQSANTRPSIGSLWAGFFALPWRDFLSGFDRCLLSGGRGFVLVFLGLIVGWWLYVPSHELLHAGACLAAGGDVETLEISRLYGGEFLAAWIPFVEAGSEYAGRLSGFDTGGCDLVYLVTVFGPFLLTLFPGVWLMLWAGRKGRAVLFGSSLPFALAPFLSLTGDAYEIGSILITRLPPWQSLQGTLRGDDVGLMFENLRALDAAPWGGFILSFLVGLLWAFATYAAGHQLARWLKRRWQKRQWLRGLDSEASAPPEPEVG